jgi:YHS domain-containing protein/mono/diheme cytochrome c family protein
VRRAANPAKHIACVALVLCASCRSDVGATATPEPAPSDEPLAASASPSSYASVIAPIFAARCSACHGETKPKGKLCLSRPASIVAGGEDGPVLGAGRPSESEIVRRVSAPLADPDHMPPEEKPQPSAEEIRALETWIAAGAPFEGEVAGLVAPRAAAPAIVVAAADPHAIATLEGALVHVERLARDSNLLWVDFAAVAASTDDALAARLLEPVRAQVAELSLARSAVGDATLATLARMPNLRRLDLRGTKVTSAGLVALAADAHLEDLVLAQTSLSDAAVEPLLAMRALKRVHLWNAGLSTDAVARLRRERPSLHVDAGDAVAAASTETEPAIQLTHEAPLAEGPGPPVNTVCPVSGKPVDPRYKLVHDGRVIGFCCPNCPAEFSAHPEKYALKKP